MIEKTYNFSGSESKLVEKIIDDENVAINHIVLAKGDRVPEHFSNSNVYLIIVRGAMWLKLDEQETCVYRAGTIVNIPYQIKMNISNEGPDLLEFFVIKSPSPKFFPPADCWTSARR